MKLPTDTVVEPPCVAPAGHACVKLPAAYTVLPTVTCAQTTPLSWTVGSGSADTVVGVAGSGGLVSACAGAAATRAIAKDRTRQNAVRSRVAVPPGAAYRPRSTMVL